MLLSTREPRIVIVGAGISGLSFAIALKRKLGFENFIIYEKASSVGGVWRDNVYPGCSSDIGIHFYQLSTDQKTDWTATHPFQPEIRTYWEELACKYDLNSRISFGRNAVNSEWDAKQHIWTVTTEDVKTGKQESVDAEILISAVGTLDVPRYPDIPGLNDFKGELFHCARWPKTELAGKKVAVIGNGASATQFLPIIAKSPKIEITQFIRSPNWIVPPIRTFYSPFHIWCITYLPFISTISRFLLFWKGELYYLIIFYLGLTNRLLSKYFANYIRQNAPPEHREKLIPSYSPGCKRVIFDTDYFSAIRQNNVELNWDGISIVCSDGIVTKKNERLTFDTIILATGFAADQFALPVKGLNGQTIQQYHDSQGGPTAYLSTTTPGFPNFFTLKGPNTATGHTSIIYMVECQIGYILQLIRPILDHEIVSVTPTVAATDEYNAKIQKRFANSVFVGCASGYRVNGTEKVFSIFPGSGVLFWWWLRRPNWSHYEVFVPEGVSE